MKHLIGMAPFNFNHGRTVPGPVYVKDWWMLVSSETWNLIAPKQAIQYDVGSLNEDGSIIPMQSTCLSVCVSLLEEALANWRRLCLGWRWVLGKSRGCGLSSLTFVSLQLTHCRQVMAWLVLLFEGVDLFDCLEGEVDGYEIWEVGGMF